MGKIILKGAIIIGIVAVLGFWPGEPAWAMWLLSAILLFVIALLGIILRALAELKIFPGGNSHPTVKYKNIEVHYTWRLNGGGIIFAYEFVRLVSKKIGKVESAFEYCAGPGFIGFSLLANGLCDRLTLADVNPEAVEAIKETIRKNNLQDRVKVYISDCLDAIPRTEQWDLVVGNPPWSLSSKGKTEIRICDPESRVHENFYRDIHKFLRPGGSILFIEGAEYTRVSHFEDMITKNGLRIIESFRSVPLIGLFGKLDEYKGGRLSAVIFLRLGLCFREAYFIWAERKSVKSEKSQRKEFART